MRKFTKRGHDAIVAEIERLWNEERPFVLEEIYEAAQLGDRSENAAYIYGRQRLRLLDKRLRVLKNKIKDVKVIDTALLPPSDFIHFGAIVTLMDEDEVSHTYQLVDREEIDPTRGWISTESPMGRALLGKELGEEFELHLPKGTKTFEIMEVYYGPTREQ